MNSLPNLVADTVILQLVFGFLLVAVLAFLFRHVPLNAATRHSVWLLALFSIVFIPILSFLPKPELLHVINSEVAESKELIQQSNTPQVNVGQSRLTFTERSQPLIYSESVVSPIGDWFEATKTTLFWWAVTVYLFMVLVKLLLVMRAFIKLKIILKSSVLAGSGLSDQVQNLTDHLKLRTKVRIGYSDLIESPQASGVFRPWILLPTSFCGKKVNQKFTLQVLLHELAHIKRRDPLVALIQPLLTAIMFWHPVMYYVNRQLTLEREMASDDWVLDRQAKLRDNDNSYAKSLVLLAESIHLEKTSFLAVACVRKNSHLSARIAALLNKKLDHRVAVHRRVNFSVVTGLICFLVFLSPIWPQLPAVFAQSSTQTIEYIDLKPPANIVSDTVSERDGLTIYTGSVYLEWNGLIITGDEIHVYRYEGYVTRMVATGNMASLEPQQSSKYSFLTLLSESVSINRSGRIRTEGASRIRRIATYRVVRGDNLSEIAQRYGVGLAQLKTVNKLGSNRIQVGQNLVLPGGGSWSDGSLSGGEFN